MNNENKADSRIVNVVRQLKSKKETPTTLSNPSTRDSFPVSNQQNPKLSASIQKHNTNIIPKVSTSKIIINDQPEQETSQKQSHLLEKIEDISLNKSEHPKSKSLNQISHGKRSRSLPPNRKQKVITHNLLIESVLIKDNANWVNIVKTDSELKRLWEESKIDIPIERYVNEHFYSNPTFLYKIEILTLNDLIESSKLPVFSIRKGNVSLKAQKENLFKSEMKRRLEIRRCDNAYKTKLDTLKEKLDLHLKHLVKFNI